MSFKGFSIFSSGGHFFFLAEQNHLSTFSRGSHKEHSCEIISKSIHWFRKRYNLSRLLTDARHTMDIERSQKLTLSLKLAQLS